MGLSGSLRTVSIALCSPPSGGGVNGFVGCGPDRSAEVLGLEVSAQKGAFIRRPEESVRLRSPGCVPCGKCENNRKSHEEEPGELGVEQSGLVRWCCPLVVLPR